MQEVTWVTDGGMLYRVAEKELLTLKRPKWRFIFYLDCFGDKHFDFLNAKWVLV